MAASTAKRLADEEAERVEGEPDTPEPQPETPDEGEPEPEPPTPAPPVEAPPAAGQRDDREIERMFKRLADEDARHTKKVVEIVGADAGELTPCPLCVTSTAGFLFPHVAEGAPVEVKDAVRRAIGDQVVPEYLSDPDAQTCDRCDGFGQTLTGSKSPGHLTKPCSECNGTGWKPVIRTPSPPQLAPAPTLPNGATMTFGGLDQWQRPSGHPHYGIPPAQVGS